MLLEAIHVMRVIPSLWNMLNSNFDGTYSHDPCVYWMNVGQEKWFL